MNPADRAGFVSGTRPGRGDRSQLYLLGPSEQILPEEGDRIQSPKRRVFKLKWMSETLKLY
jgi:hypothetical protein